LARPEVHGTFSQPGPSHPAASGRLTRTLGVSQTPIVALEFRRFQLRRARSLAASNGFCSPPRSDHLRVWRQVREQPGGLIRAPSPLTPQPSPAVPSQAAPVASSTARRLTPRLTTGPATAGCLGPAWGTRYILPARAKPSRRIGPVNSNVRRHTRNYCRPATTFQLRRNLCRMTMKILVAVLGFAVAFLGFRLFKLGKR
jgi:hypothetical protein